MVQPFIDILTKRSCFVVFNRITTPHRFAYFFFTYILIATMSQFVCYRRNKVVAIHQLKCISILDVFISSEFLKKEILVFSQKNNLR